MSGDRDAFDEEESADTLSAGFDVSPRTPRERQGGSRNRIMAIGVVVVAALALAVVVFNGLNDASMFYYNVDEALANKVELSDKRFRMQGNVIEGSIHKTETGVDFTLAFGDSKVDVVNRGNPPELFSPKIPVIIEGSFDGDVFRSDEIIIRHDNNYEEEHQDRIDDANKDANKRSGSPG